MHTITHSHTHTHINLCYVPSIAPEAFVNAVGQIVEAWGPTVERGQGLTGEAAAVALLLDEGARLSGSALVRACLLLHDLAQLSRDPSGRSLLCFSTLLVTFHTRKLAFLIT